MVAQGIPVLSQEIFQQRESCLEEQKCRLLTQLIYKNTSHEYRNQT